MKKRHRKKVYGFAFIGNPILFDCTLPYKLNSDITICRPTAHQQRHIRSRIFSLNRDEDFREPYESTIQDEPRSVKRRLLGIRPTEDRVQYITGLPESRWKYAIVKYRSDYPLVEEYLAQEIVDLELASLINHRPLHLFPSIGSRAYPILKNTELFDFLLHASWERHEDVWSLADLVQLKSLYEAMVRVRMTFPSLYHSYTLFRSLPRLKGYNELLCLGLFGVIESLLTHNPVGESDSLNHQIASKAILLSNRFTDEIDYSTFGEINRAKLWKLLYAFRSKIAHGGVADFNRQFQVLDSAISVQRFLERFLRSLLQNALREPQLYVDLKEC